MKSSDYNFFSSIKLYVYVLKIYFNCVKIKYKYNLSVSKTSHPNTVKHDTTTLLYTGFLFYLFNYPNRNIHFPRTLSITDVNEKSHKRQW